MNHTLREMERVNDLPFGAIQMIRWIKPLKEEHQISAPLMQSLTFSGQQMPTSLSKTSY